FFFCANHTWNRSWNGTKEYEPDTGDVIFNIAMCENEKCLHVETPSKVGDSQHAFVARIYYPGGKSEFAC
ncbi:MAG: hypothetical protein MJ232_08050, partial [archaeon]|nr:hypothetical protein [archaeon]